MMAPSPATMPCNKKNKRNEEVKWEEMPSDLLISLAKELMRSSPSDLVWFLAVCRSWKLAASAALSSSPIVARLYSLEGVWEPLLPVQRKDDPHVVHRLPANDRVCFGCSRGLLGFYDPHLRFSLFNPRTGLELPLPTPLFPDLLETAAAVDSPSSRGGRVTGGITYTIEGKRADGYSCFVDFDFASTLLISSSPSPSPTANHPPPVLLFSYGARRSRKRLIYCSLDGSRRWAPLSTPKQPFRYDGVAYHRGRFYLFDRTSSTLFTCEIPAAGSSSSSSSVVGFREFPVRNPVDTSGDPNVRTHLVPRGADLLLVVETASWRWWDRRELQSSSFRVFRLEWNEARWVELSDIGHDALFLGWNDPFALSARDFAGFRGNCVYLLAPYTCLRKVSAEFAPFHYGYMVYDIGRRTWERVSCNYRPSPLLLQAFWLDPRYQT